MSANLASLNASPRSIPIGGEVFEVHPLTLADQGKLQAWLETQLPDPLGLVQAHIDRAKPTMEVQKFLLREALHEASRTRVFLNSPEALPYLNSAHGIVEILWLSIAKGRPDFTRERARDVFGSMTPADVLKLQSATELDQVMAEPDPKAAGG
jgi:hypothetical protein